MKSWFVAHTHPMKEQFAEQNLREQGFDVYLPRFKKMHRHARKVEEVLTPLFPRYLFVALDVETARWRSINGTRGVSYLLQNDGLPAKVPEKIIETLKERETADGLVSINSLIAFIKGDKVRILKGAFKDQLATFETMDAKQRVQLLLTFLGREMKVSLPAYAVEAG
ncbi:MAG: transcriptional activator RfaH [Alphaproteobacteria bacterium]|nr:transcriptional activator RfaH [Alphaproteobacteria bacterium]